MDAAGEGEDLVEVLALYPELKLARRVPGVLADLEGRDDDGVDGPARLSRGGSGRERQDQEERQQEKPGWEMARTDAAAKEERQRSTA